MITQKRHFFYQPSPLGSIICWSWTFVIFFIGVIIWLEITHFQWITLFFFVLFAFTAWAEIHFRSIQIYDHQLVVSRITNPHWLVIDLDKISHVQTSKYQLGFVAKTKIYSFILPANSVIEIKELITHW
ncbi:EbsA family protein [Lentilactobacillus sp. IMAU92037]|uniref:EbsA family protein n=1 Tax=Lentilactobacillus TaxID=2767893 RepID=UPI001C27E647|nr:MULTISPECIES: EbsA family protein [Lentilactobacillus]MBU9788989.1 EbsA family protein [Lentilactobacillus dabitei]MBV0929757.1 EbsA family protein [Lentilactobacillus dabitei]MDM7517148.1 EbsA family protein [Lentilactobacillus sp. TOM.63]